MALPLILPAASAVAKASGVALASGLTTKLLLDRIRSNYDVGNTEEITNELMRRNNIGIDSHTKSTTLNIPVAENALVLRPEYRTETYVVPDQYNPIKSIIEVQDSKGNRKFVDDSHLYDTAEEVPNPEKPQKNDDKKPFWKTTTGKILKWGLIGGGSAAALPWVGGGAYRYFRDYIPYALSKTINTSEFNDSSNEIDTDATRKNNSDKIYIAEIAE